MDTFPKLSLGAAVFLLSFSVHAAIPPSVLRFNAQASGPSTTYTAALDGAYTVPKVASVGSGIVPLTPNVSAYTTMGNAAYVSSVAAPIGETITAFKVANPISKANLGNAIIKGMRAANGLSLLVMAGGAVYDYIKAQNMDVDGLGRFTVQQTFFPDSACTFSSLVPKPHINNNTYQQICVVATINDTPTYDYMCKVTSFDNADFTTQVKCLRSAQTTQKVPITDTQALQNFTNSQTLSSPDVVKKLVDTGNAPDYSDTSQFTGPSLVNDPPVKQTLPDGRQVTQEVSHNLTYNDNSITITDNTKITTVNPDGTTSTTQTNNPVPNAPVTNGNPVGLPNANSPTDCDKYPNSIGCADFGAPPAPDTVETVNVPLDFQPANWGSGTCPAPMALNLSRGTYYLEWQPTCNFATGLRPILLAFSYLLAGYIVLGAVKT